MSVFVSRPAEIEAMRFKGGGYNGQDAHRIVAWVVANGGEARYEPETRRIGHGVTVSPARIMVRTKDGWQPCAPGEWIVKSSSDCLSGHTDCTVDCGWCKGARDFRPVRDLSEVRVPLTWEPGPAAVTP